MLIGPWQPASVYHQPWLVCHMTILGVSDPFNPSAYMIDPWLAGQPQHERGNRSTPPSRIRWCMTTTAYSSRIPKLSRIKQHLGSPPQGFPFLLLCRKFQLNRSNYGMWMFLRSSLGFMLSHFVKIYSHQATRPTASLWENVVARGMENG